MLIFNSLTLTGQVKLSYGFRMGILCSTNSFQSMKLHLPITLLTVLLSAFVAQAVEIPDDYEQIDLWTPSYLNDYTANTSSDKNAFLLWSDISITPTTNTTWTSSTSLINGGNHIFTPAEEATPSLSFSNGQSQVFRDFSSLTLIPSLN